MAGGSTALSYQLTYETHWMEAMINAEQRGAYAFACQYAEALLVCLGVNNKEMPQEPVLKGKNVQEAMGTWADYYFKLIKAISKQVKHNIDDVRKRYGKAEMSIPSFSERKEISLGQ